MNIPLTENFHRYFAVELALSAKQKRDVFRTRYRVYCEEFCYEPAERFPDHQERDEFDDVSLHCLIRHRATGMPAGCVRMVPGSIEHTHHLLPMEKYCARSLDPDFRAALRHNRESVAEISRLAVDSTFRRRHNESADRFGVGELVFAVEEQRVFPLIGISAFLAAAALCIINDRHRGVAMMEPFLPKLMRKSGIIFTKVGQDMDYHGVRAPYFITSDAALANIRPELRQLYADIFSTIERAIVHS